MPNRGIALLAAALLVATLARPVRAENPFADLPLDHWGYHAVARLKAARIVEDGPRSAAGGAQPVTRYEMAFLVARMLDRLDSLIRERAAAAKREKQQARSGAPAPTPREVRAQVLGELADQIARLVEKQATPAGGKEGSPAPARPSARAPAPSPPPSPSPAPATTASPSPPGPPAASAAPPVPAGAKETDPPPGAAAGGQEGGGRQSQTHVGLKGEAAGPAAGGRLVLTPEAEDVIRDLFVQAVAEQVTKELARLQETDKATKVQAAPAPGDPAALRQWVDRKVTELAARLGATQAALEELRSGQGQPETPAGTTDPRLEAAKRALADLKRLVDIQAGQLAADIANLTAEFEGELQVLGVRLDRLDSLFTSLERRVSALEREQASTRSALRRHLAEHAKVQVSGTFTTVLDLVSLDNPEAIPWLDPRRLDADGDDVVVVPGDRRTGKVRGGVDPGDVFEESAFFNTLDLAVKLAPRPGTTLRAGLWGLLERSLETGALQDARLEPRLSLTTPGTLRRAYAGRLKPEAVAARFDPFTLDLDRLADELDARVDATGRRIDPPAQEGRPEQPPELVFNVGDDERVEQGLDRWIVQDHSLPLWGATWELQTGPLNVLQTLAWLDPGEYLFANDMVVRAGPGDIGLRYVRQFDGGLGPGPGESRWGSDGPDADPQSSVVQVRGRARYDALTVDGTYARDFTGKGGQAATVHLGTDLGLILGSVGYTRVDADFNPFLAREWDPEEGDVVPGHQRVLLQGLVDLLSLGMKLGYSQTSPVGAGEGPADRAFFFGGRAALPALPVFVSGEFGRQLSDDGELKPQYHTRLRLALENYTLSPYLALDASYEWVDNEIENEVWYYGGNWTGDATTRGRLAARLTPVPGWTLVAAYTRESRDLLPPGGDQQPATPFGVPDEELATAEAGVRYAAKLRLPVPLDLVAEYRYKNQWDLVNDVSWAEPLHSLGATLSTEYRGATISLAGAWATGHNEAYDDNDDWGTERGTELPPRGEGRKLRYGRDTWGEVVSTDTVVGLGLEYPLYERGHLWMRARHVSSRVRSRDNLTIPVELAKKVDSYSASEVLVGVSMDI